MSDQRYLVTARKYRPQRFEEIVAQGHVSETLKNAITLDRLAHAYLFSGPRGVGKTTAARILAKAINCTSSLAERDGGEPCRSCESCKTFEEGRSLNIIEIDAASNNRVEDIRELRDTVLIPPQGSRKKVYIIDEVHMLSNAAFNALLKTLEEPPPYALFIFATTEPNKVLPTILSRCQRFDFRRISVPEIVSHLEVICRTENIQADEASLMLIAQKGDGALRDALSAFDQAVSLCGTSLIYAELAQAFGVVDVELFFEVSQHVDAGNSAGLLMLVDKIIRQGYDLQEFLIGLSSHLRNLLVANTMADTSLIEVAEAVRHQYAVTSKQHSETDLLRLLMVVADGEDKLKTSAQPRLQLELTLLKMAAMAHAVDLKQALQKLEKLEADVSEGKISSPARSSDAPIKAESTQPVVARMVVSDAPPSGSTPPSASAPAQPAASATQPPVSVDVPIANAPAQSPASVQPAASPSLPDHTGPTAVNDQPPAQAFHHDNAPETFPVSETNGGATYTHDASDYMAPMPSEAPVVDVAPALAPAAVVTPASEIQTQVALSKPATAQEEQPVQASSSQKSYQGLFGAPALRKVQTASPGAQSDEPATDKGAVSIKEAPSSELDEITKIWPEFLKHMQVERIHVSALLQHARPIQVQDETLVLAVPDEFHKRMLSNQQDFLLDHLCNFAMVPVERTSFVIDMMGSDELVQQETPSEIDPYEYMQKKRQESPVIRAIFDDFGGEMVW